MKAYLVMMLQPWSTLQLIPSLYPLSVPDGPNDPVGFAPIFATREAAERYCEGQPRQIVEVETAQRPDAEQSERE